LSALLSDLLSLGKGVSSRSGGMIQIRERLHFSTGKEGFSAGFLA
jgi:hypothetical protein